MGRSSWSSWRPGKTNVPAHGSQAGGILHKERGLSVRSIFTFNRLAKARPQGAQSLDSIYLLKCKLHGEAHAQPKLEWYPPRPQVSRTDQTKAKAERNQQGNVAPHLGKTAVQTTLFILGKFAWGIKAREESRSSGKKKIPSFANVILRNPIAWYIVVRLWTQKTSPVKKTKQQHQNLKGSLIYFWHFFSTATAKWIDAPNLLVFLRILLYV